MKKSKKNKITSKAEEIEAAWLMHKLTPGQIRSIWLNRHLLKQRGRCAYCNVLMSIEPMPEKLDRRATIDHVVARAKGGKDVESNTVAACEMCNNVKADMTREEYEKHPIRLKRLEQANTPPDRLSANPASKYYDDDAMTRGVGVYFRGRERDDVEEYCLSEKWVRIPAGKAVDRRGRPITVKLTGEIKVYFLDIQ